MTDEPPIHNSRYRHYKGKEYTVLGTARHSETLEELVVYRQEYGDQGLWVRPKSMFSETVKVEGKEVARFAKLHPGTLVLISSNTPQNLCFGLRGTDRDGVREWPGRTPRWGYSNNQSGLTSPFEEKVA